ncbi:MAG: SurA N-terminal domain-containing protein [Rhodobacteraceae bacterium]|nr:SurA N-terminal domain-containing protein [Paracoccaceae bacterium]
MATGKRNRVFVWVILGLIFVGLMGFGSTGLTSRQRSIGTVGDKDISVQNYGNGLNAQLRRIQEQYGVPVSFAQAQAAGIDQIVISQLVSDRVLDNETSQLGLSVGDDIILQQLLSIQEFAGFDGNFDRENYRAALNRNDTTEETFENGLREDISRNVLTSAITSGVPTPKAYAQALAGFIGETRAISWAPLNAAALAAPIAAPDDAALLAQYESTPAAYTADETRHIRYAWLTPEMIIDEVTVDESAIRDLYQERITQYVQEERRLVERLVYPDQAAADAARADYDNGISGFADLVTARGLTLADTDMGDVSLGDLGDSGATIFAAQTGDVVGPLPSSLGPALFRVNAVLAAQETPFEEARAALRDGLAATRARRVIDDAREGMADLIAGGAGVSDLVERTAMQLGEITWSAGDAEGIAAYEAFRSAAAAAQTGEYATLNELADGGIFAIELIELVPAALIDFDIVKDQVAADWSAGETQRAVLAQAEQLAESLANSPADAAASFEAAGLVATDVPNLTRRDIITGTPESFVTSIYAMEPGAAIALAHDGGAVIVRLETINAADVDDPALAAQADMLGRQAVQGIAQDIFTAYSDDLRRNTDIRLDDAVIAAVNAQFQ